MQQPNGGEHARHDANLIAGHAAGDLTELDRLRADSLLATCDECATVRRDLVAIAAATRSVPAPATRSHDFRLTPEQADRLRRGSWLRAFLRPFAATSSPIRPMAAAFTSLGVVGLLVGVTLTGGSAALITGVVNDRDGGAGGAGAVAATEGAAAAPEFQALGSPNGPRPAPSDRIAVQMASGQAGREDDMKASTSADATAHAPQPTQVAVGEAGGPGNEDAEAPATPGVPAAEPAWPTQSFVIAGSLALLGIGLLLFGLRIASRKVR